MSNLCWLKLVKVVKILETLGIQYNFDVLYLKIKSFETYVKVYYRCIVVKRAWLNLAIAQLKKNALHWEQYDWFGYHNI